MKKLFLFLASLFLVQLLSAQTKALPACKTINAEIAEINNSFDNIVNKFKSKEDKISLIKTYFSEFSVCSEKGKIKDYGRNIEFIFSFTDAYYRGNRYSFRNFYKKVFRKIKEEFDSTHAYKLSKEQFGKSCYFYEKDKEITTSKRNIKLLLAYKDPVDESTAYSVVLVFDYYPKR